MLGISAIEHFEYDCLEVTLRRKISSLLEAFCIKAFTLHFCHILELSLTNKVVIRTAEILVYSKFLSYSGPTATCLCVLFRWKLFL